MLEAAHSPLEAWESFYVIIGSSAAALIGLQFVVIALIADIDVPSTHASIGAFATPTIVHFAAVVFVAATMSAPWPSVADIGVVFIVVGIGGIVYVGINARRARRQHDYKPVWQDWLWHTLLPFLAYSALLVAAFILRSHLILALFIIAGKTLLLLFVGIHNAWDTVTYLVIDRAQAAKQKSET